MGSRKGGGEIKTAQEQIEQSGSAGPWVEQTKEGVKEGMITNSVKETDNTGGYVEGGGGKGAKLSENPDQGSYTEGFKGPPKTRGNCQGPPCKTSSKRSKKSGKKRNRPEIKISNGDSVSQRNYRTKARQLAGEKGRRGHTGRGKGIGRGLIMSHTLWGWVWQGLGQRVMSQNKKRWGSKR